MLQLSDKSLDLLRACDGASTVDSIVARVQDADGQFAGVPAHQSVRIGLELLRHDGLVEERHEH